ncbi:LptE family protein [Fodinibius halophilus]|uniref:LptE family protein n=1 Tax=Fodinibius halophilus TaxID=1736908 RepID=A0A6M1T936_9BACT|nr:LptE family protein [Fodinibius halophilus]NGP89965.1 LptE family protein [Fodinibius halophilus]
MVSNNIRSLLLLILLCFVTTGCFRYSFTGTSIPEDVNTVYIPFFADQSNSGVSNLSDILNEALIDRFISQSRLQLANSRSDADAILEGSIRRYTNQAFSLSGNQQTSRNEVKISVRATYKYTDKDQAEWSTTFSGSETYDTNENPIEGETNAAREALSQVADNMFNDAVSGW